MDLREKKTTRSIKNAFLELRAKKPIEKITIKELTEKAEISKGTFYLHYADIYALSESLENEVIRELTESIPDADGILKNPSEFTRNLALAFISNSAMINAVFSGSRASVLPKVLEENLLRKIEKIKPSLITNPYFRVELSARVYGDFYAYYNHSKKFKTEDIVSALCRMTFTSIN